MKQVASLELAQEQYPEAKHYAVQPDNTCMVYEEGDDLPVIEQPAVPQQAAADKIAAKVCERLGISKEELSILLAAATN